MNKVELRNFMYDNMLLNDIYIPLMLKTCNIIRNIRNLCCLLFPPDSLTSIWVRTN